MIAPVKRIGTVAKLKRAATAARKVRKEWKKQVLVCAGTGCLANGSARVIDAGKKRIGNLGDVDGFVQ